MFIDILEIVIEIRRTCNFSHFTNLLHNLNDNLIDVLLILVSYLCNCSPFIGGFNEKKRNKYEGK